MISSAMCKARRQRCSSLSLQAPARVLPAGRSLAAKASGSSELQLEHGVVDVPASVIGSSCCVRCASVEGGKKRSIWVGFFFHFFFFFKQLLVNLANCGWDLV